MTQFLSKIEQAILVESASKVVQFRNPDPAPEFVDALKRLAGLGLVRVSRRGKETIYSLTAKGMARGEKEGRKLKNRKLQLEARKRAN